MSLCMVHPEATRPNGPPAAKLGVFDVSCQTNASRKRMNGGNKSSIHPSSQYFGDDLDFEPLSVGVAPAIPTTPSDLDANFVAIYNRVMIGGLHADKIGRLLAQHGLTPVTPKPYLPHQIRVVLRRHPTATTIRANSTKLENCRRTRW